MRLTPKHPAPEDSALQDGLADRFQVRLRWWQQTVAGGQQRADLLQFM